MTKNVTYKNFVEALDNLRIEKDYSYNRLALSIGMTSSYLYSIINKRIATAPKNEVIEKMQNFLILNPNIFLNTI